MLKVAGMRVVEFEASHKHPGNAEPQLGEWIQHLK